MAEFEERLPASRTGNIHVHKNLREACGICQDRRADDPEIVRE
jgi:hypothetical protein